MDTSSSLKASATVEAPSGGAPGAAGGIADGVPSQYNHNCIEKGQYKPPSRVHLTPNQKKTRHKMIMAVEWMVARHGIERVGVLTLSFGVPGSGKGSYETWALRQQAKHWGFVQDRWCSFRTNVVAVRYADWVCVFELHRDRVWHIHVVVATKEDIRTGTDIETLSNYKLPYWMRRGKHLRNEALAAEWTDLRRICCKYRFGRVELLPVRKSGEAVGFYLGDYLVKTYNATADGKRCRLVRFSQCINEAITTPFTIVSLGNLIHRTRLKIAADMLRLTDYGDFAEYFGPQWNYFLKNTFAWIPMPCRFAKGDFESGVAGRVLAEYAKAPKLYLDDRGKAKIDQVASELWRRLREALEENQEARLKYQASCLSDNWGDRPLTAADMQDDLFDSPDNPF
jgi:hypothetical protein